jgi:hypothetical protein
LILIRLKKGEECGLYNHNLVLKKNITILLKLEDKIADMRAAFFAVQVGKICREETTLAGRVWQHGHIFSETGITVLRPVSLC